MIAGKTILHKGLVPAAKALELVLDSAHCVGSESVAIANAYNRVLAENLAAKRTQPPFPASAMDGYAVRFEDVETVPATLTLIGESAAGHPFDGELEKGQCIRIFTGAPIPLSADTIIIQENVSIDGEQITILQSAPKGKFVRPAGLDFSEGQVLLKKGTVLDPQALSLVASMDHPEINVCQKPIVSIIATGDELVLPGEILHSGQIIASNTFGVAAIAESAGADVRNLGIAKDTMEDLIEVVGGALEAGSDLIVTSGGASVGDHDLVKPVMKHFGFEFSFVKIAIRPGKPVLFGKAIIDGKIRRFLGLAGNPVSSLVSSHIYLKPLINLLAGYPPELAKPVLAILGCDLPENDEREDYMRGTASRGKDGELIVEPFAKQDSSMLATLSRADCLVVRPVHAPAAKTGDTVEAIMLRNV